MLSKHFHLEKIHSVVQQIVISQTDFTVIICINIVDNFMLFAPCAVLYSHFVGSYEGWNFNSDNYLFTTDTK